MRPPARDLHGKKRSQRQTGCDSTLLEREGASRARGKRAAARESAGRSEMPRARSRAAGVWERGARIVRGAGVARLSTLDRRASLASGHHTECLQRDMVGEGGRGREAARAEHGEEGREGEPERDRGSRGGEERWEEEGGGRGGREARQREAEEARGGERRCGGEGEGEGVPVCRGLGLGLVGLGCCPIEHLSPASRPPSPPSEPEKRPSRFALGSRVFLSVCGPSDGCRPPPPPTALPSAPCLRVPWVSSPAGGVGLVPGCCSRRPVPWPWRARGGRRCFP